MKKSPIYLGACAAILAIAGAFTTKTSTKVAQITGWTKQGQNSTKVTCFTTGSGQCHSALGSTLYTKGLVNTLRTKQ